MKIAVFFSGRGSNFKALLDSPVGSSICLGLTDNPQALGIQCAQRAQKPTVIIDYHQCLDKKDFEEKIITALEAYQPDYLVLAGVMRILSKEFINAYEGRIINIHPSLLPSYQGLNTHARVLQRSNKIHGVTIHFVTAHVDSGPIIAQAALPVHHQDTPESLEKRILHLEHRLYPRVLSWLIEEKITYNIATGLVKTPEPAGFWVNDLHD